MKTIKLSNGTLQHTLPGWVGIQQLNEPISKTKWTNLNRPISEQWEFEASDKSKKAGFSKWVVQSINNKLECEWGGFRFKKHCKHIDQVMNF